MQIVMVHSKEMRTLVVIYFLVSSLQVLACDCIVYSDSKDYLTEVDLVFTGKVVELVKAETEEVGIPEFFDTIPDGREQWKAMNPDQYYARVIMIENIKGSITQTDTLFFVSEFTNCEPRYEISQSYLFFANKMKDNIHMMVACTPWGKLEDCEQTIEELKK